MKRRNTYRRRSKSRRRHNRKVSRKRMTRVQKQRGGYYGARPQPYALDSYWVAGEEEAPRIMTAEEIQQKRMEDDKGV
jgi:hypothetical protein